jgi:hypothetical protein
MSTEKPAIPAPPQMRIDFAKHPKLYAWLATELYRRKGRLHGMRGFVVEMLTEVMEERQSERRAAAAAAAAAAMAAVDDSSDAI